MLSAAALPRFGQLRFRRAGAGPALVLLHGLLGSSLTWRGIAPQLATHFTCFALELPGIGLSDPLPGSDMSLPALSGWLEAALGALDVDRCSIMASSWGGALALAFAAAPAGQRLDRMALVAPAHPHWIPTRRQRWLLSPPWTRCLAALAGHAPRAWQRAALAQMFGDPARCPAESLAIYREILRRPPLPRSLAGYARGWNAHFQRLALAAIPTPTLLVWGDRDRAVSILSAPALLRALPNAQLCSLAGLGHLPFEEDSVRFNQALLPFLLGSRNP